MQLDSSSSKGRGRVDSEECERGQHGEAAVPHLKDGCCGAGDGLQPGVFWWWNKMKNRKGRILDPQNRVMYVPLEAILHCGYQLLLWCYFPGILWIWSFHIRVESSFSKWHQFAGWEKVACVCVCVCVSRHICTLVNALVITFSLTSPYSSIRTAETSLEFKTNHRLFHNLQ